MVLAIFGNYIRNTYQYNRKLKKLVPGALYTKTVKTDNPFDKPLIVEYEIVEIKENWVKYKYVKYLEHDSLTEPIETFLANCKPV